MVLNLLQQIFRAAINFLAIVWEEIEEFSFLLL